MEDPKTKTTPRNLTRLELEQCTLIYIHESQYYWWAISLWWVQSLSSN